MPKRCGCSDTCTCLILAGAGITVEGIGTVERPYEIGSETGDLSTVLSFTDSATIDFTTLGVGTSLDPYEVSAAATIAMTDLTDLGVGQVPANGEVPVWHTDHWEFEAPAGAPGVGIPVAGAIGQLLAKDSATDYDTAWIDPIPFRVAGGTVGVNLTAQASNFSAVTFPVGRFTVAPLVLVSMVSAPGGSAKFVPRTLNATTAGVSVYVYTGDQSTQTGGVTVAWLAVEMLPGVAAG